MGKLIQSTIQIRIDGVYYLLEELDTDKKKEIYKNLFYRSAAVSGYEAVKSK